jgi:hypothetical protein
MREKIWKGISLIISPRNNEKECDEKEHELSWQFSVGFEARRSFWNPSKVLWRYLEACEAGRRTCWKEFRTRREIW